MKRCPHIASTEREFRRQKRKEMRMLRKAIRSIRLGCALLPPEAYKNLCTAFVAIETANDICKPWWKNA